MIDHTNINIPPAGEVDFANASEICGYQHLICRLFDLAGGYDVPLKSNPAIREIELQSCLWTDKVKTLIDSLISGIRVLGMTIGDIPRLTSSYGAMHQIGYGFPCTDYIRQISITIADLWAKGNRNVTETDVVLGLAREANRDIGAMDKKYAHFAYSAIDRWIDQLSQRSVGSKIPFGERYARLAYLLNDNLYAYLGTIGQAKAKRQWIIDYSLSESQLNKLSASDLQHYIYFVNAASTTSPSGALITYSEYKNILAKLIAHSNTDRYTSQAAEIDIATIQTA